MVIQQVLVLKAQALSIKMMAYKLVVLKKIAPLLSKEKYCKLGIYFFTLHY